MNSGETQSVVLGAVQLATQIEWPSVTASGWLMHAPFAAWITQALRPASYVELGTHYGFSYFSVCETAKTIGLEMRAYAVDHWRGDDHAGAYGEQVYDSVVQHNTLRYGDWSTLLRMGFDQAAERFGDGEVDLLHIDGFHTYEAVAHDFGTWRRTLSDRAVVLFHDVREYQEGFGVHRFWDEIRRQYPSFTFSFGHGLGVLAVGSNMPEAVRALCSLDRSDEGDDLRQVFGLLGGAVQSGHERADLDRRLSLEESRLRALHVELDATRRELELVERDRQAVDADRMRLHDEWQAARSGNAALQSALETAQLDLASSAADLRRVKQSLASIQNTRRFKAAFGWRRRLNRG